MVAVDSRFRGNDGLSGSPPPARPGECSRFRGACPRESGGMTGLCLTQQSGLIIVTPVYIGSAPDSMFRRRCDYETVLRAVQQSGNPRAFMVVVDSRFRGNDGLSGSLPPVRPGECFRFRAACPRESGGNDRSFVSLQQSGSALVTPVYSDVWIGSAPDSMFRRRCGYEAVPRAVQESGNPWAFMVAVDSRFRGNDGLSRSLPPVRPGGVFLFPRGRPRKSGGMTGLLSHCNNRGAPSSPRCTAMSGSRARRTPCFARDAATRRYSGPFEMDVAEYLPFVADAFILWDSYPD